MSQIERAAPKINEEKDIAQHKLILPKSSVPKLFNILTEKEEIANRGSAHEKEKIAR